MKWLINNVYHNLNSALNPANAAIKFYLEGLDYKVISYPDNLNGSGEFNKIVGGDTVAIAYPTFYKTSSTALGYEYDLVSYLHSKGSSLVGLVGDSLTLRELPIFMEREIKILNMFDVLVISNIKMQQALENVGVDTPCIIQGLYPITDIYYSLKKKAIVTDNFLYTGNLGKAGFLDKFSFHNQSSKIDAYGPSASKSLINNQFVDYHGSLKFKELNEEISSFNGFGIAWDGGNIAIDSSDGRYTRYNFPYKVSQYISLNIPIIAWSGSAIADFVNKHRLGVTLSKFEDIEDIVNNLSEYELSEIRMNTTAMAARIRSGYDFILAILQAEQLLIK